MKTLPQIAIFDSLTANKAQLEPIEPGHVKMYVCGLTVYDDAHIGHARMMMVFDMVVRYIRSQGYRVTYVRNITDIDDKIINRARENGESISSLTERTIADLHAVLDELGLLAPDIEPRATETLDEMIALIQKLIDKGLAYRSDNGDVLYSVKKFPNYGHLSKKRLEDLRAGERVELAEGKDDPLDFVLWKAAKPDEPKWPSPFGDGRPGWHIECSAMSTKHLGQHFDIHGGGMDLKFPHHENEIAQSEGAHDCKYANIWMHNGFINIDNEKMSKSLGNFFTLRDILTQYHPEVIRAFMIGTHYRRPINFSDEALNAAKKITDKFYNVLAQAEPHQGTLLEQYQTRFDQAMSDDFNSPGAMAVLHELAQGYKQADAKDAQDYAYTLRVLAQQIGYLQTDSDAYLNDRRGNKATADQLSDAEIDSAIEARNAARAAKDYAKADSLRDWLSEHGIGLEDAPSGVTWYRK